MLSVLAVVHWLGVVVASGGAMSVFPRDGATNVCPDTPLRISFAATAELAANDRVQIVDTTDGAVVETVDVGVPSATKTKVIGGLSGFNYFPVNVEGREVTIHPRHGVLTTGKTYAVSVSGGALPLSWRFTTKTAAPPADSRRLTVAADGTGDFATIQGALDFIPAGNRTPRTIFVRRGTYAEIIFVADKHGITVRGEDRDNSIITYANNEKFNPAGNPYAVPGANPSDAVVSRGDVIYHRAVFTAHRTNDLVLANLTIRNTTPAGGSQAEAVILNGTGTARAILKDLNLVSLQDTLQINGQAYVANCTIEGDVDFMWGQGPVFFERCVCRSTRSAAYYTQVRNPGTHHGFVFVRCTFTGLPGVVGNYLARVSPQRFPHSEVVLIDCVLGTAVGPARWQLQDVPPGTATPGDVHFWEFTSRKPRKPADAALIATYRNPAFVLGNGWNPKVVTDSRSLAE